METNEFPAEMTDDIVKIKRIIREHFDAHMEKIWVVYPSQRYVDALYNFFEQGFIEGQQRIIRALDISVNTKP